MGTLSRCRLHQAALDKIDEQRTCVSRRLHHPNGAVREFTIAPELRRGLPSKWRVSDDECDHFFFYDSLSALIASLVCLVISCTLFGHCVFLSCAVRPKRIFSERYFHRSPGSRQLYLYLFYLFI